jgi:hypothetical protein
MKSMQTIKMGFYRTTAIILSFLVMVFLATGCEDHTKPSQVVKPTTHTPSHVEEKIKLKTIIANSVPIEKAQTLEQVIINGLEWEFSNGEKAYPSKEFILWSRELDKQAMAVVKVSKTSNPWYNLVFLSYNQHQWEIQGFIDSPINKEDLLTEKNGLNLPIQKFVVAKLSLESQKKNIWLFADEKNLLS